MPTTLDIDEDALHAAKESAVLEKTTAAAEEETVRMESTIRSATADDAQAVCDIYNHYALNTVITFDEQPLASAELRRQILESSESLPWLVFEDHGDILGYAYAGKWKSRCAYRFSVETTVYLAPQCTGRGIGSALYEALISDLRAASRHSAIAGIALPNPASIALHEELGFAKVAHFKEVGWKFDRWIDVGYWELLL